MSCRSSAILAIVLLFGAAGAAWAGKTIFKCVRNGQTILADHPCEATESTATTVAPGSPLGRWHGQTQFQAKENGRYLTSARTVATLTLELTTDGKATGTSPENGCKLRGTWSDGGGPRIVALDLDVSECRFAGANRRYTGALIVSAADASAELSLVSGAAAQAGQGAKVYDIKGTVRQ